MIFLHNPYKWAWVVDKMYWKRKKREKERNVDIRRSIEKKEKKEKHSHALQIKDGERIISCYGVIMIIMFPRTFTPWSECMIFFSIDPLFDLAIYATQVCFNFILPKLHISLLEVGRKAKHHCLGEDTNTIEWLESTIWGEVWAKFSIAKVIKTPSMLHRG